MPRMKFFSSGDQPTAVMDSVPQSLDDQLQTAQAEYDSAVVRLHELEADFQQKAPVVTADQFQKLESNLRQQAMVVESRQRALEAVGKLLFEERQAEEQKQAATARAGQRSLLLAKLDAVHSEMCQLEEMKRVPIDHRLAILNSERSAILLELSTLKETTNAA